jgi:glycolate oxidase
MSARFLQELRAGVATVIDESDALIAYSRDQCVLAEAGKPVAAVLATSTDDVISTIRLAAEHGVPVVARGAGTGLAGGANALDGCVVLVLSRMGRILDLDPVSRTVRAQPGVVNGDLDRAAREHGLWYAPDPGSRDSSSIGGNLATNAGGMCCAKYGVTADHVLRLSAVIGTGELVTVGTMTRKNVAGLTSPDYWWGRREHWA